ncbi:hypothetical protein PENDEC_c025G04807 [Penicillium decumbens]|uniref:Auxiliary Activity family 9 catalytic domain-containing protein n=1 Tax=Penicillium decumbens TaxID=69771 RepID=A0A1V6NZV9_PENDC|nr:hypothetical protein PENDEC_c025G04807 [Penicillium decumbens]
MSLSKIAGVVLGSAALVAAHGYVTGAVVDGTYYGGYVVSQYSYEQNAPETIDLGFIDGTGYTSPDIICHKNAQPGTLTAPVKAGGSVELQWTDWPSSHHGPVITYLANCHGDCSKVDKTALKFFKIDSEGLDSDSAEPGTWASDKLIANNNSRIIPIPSSIESGNYVLRHEIIALHSANNKDGAQNYPQCLNLKVTGGGSDSPSGTLGTELYKDTDKGILVNIYQSLSSYTIPGPALYKGASSGSATTTAPTAASTIASVSSVSAFPIRSSSAISPSDTASACPAALEDTESAAPTVTDAATADATVTDKPVSQTSSVPSVSVTASVGGYSAQSSSTGSTPNASDYNSSDWNSYLSSLSTDQVLSLLRQTFQWLVADKKHARDLTN